MRESPDLETTVHGIPCGVVVDSYTRVKGSFSRNAPSDLDYYGYSEAEWHLIDRRGYRAEWLERKLSNADRIQIGAEVDANYRKGDDE